MVIAQDLYEQACLLADQDRLDEATVVCEEAVARGSGGRNAVRTLALLLVAMGRRDEGVALVQSELTAEDGLAWLSHAVVMAMEQRDLTLAGDLASILATYRWGSRWPQSKQGSDTEFRSRAGRPDVLLSISKLKHDSEQFRLMRQRGILGPEFDAMIQEYEAIATRLAPIGINARVPLTPEDDRRIGEVYSRLVHVHQAPRINRALSDSWERELVQEKYLNYAPGVVVIDDFLSAPALDELRRFCIESTVWSGNRYADGRLGAFFFAGFNCPLLLQIAEEIRDALPAVIGSHPLRQLWGFKNSPNLPADSTTHADFAAVNVNFWITPESANLDPSSGGLVVYDVTAPLNWDFRSYNERLGLIRSYIAEKRARIIRIPYKQNRAIIFNSDLFHETEGITFSPEFENRRVNITMLYGDRELDNHFPPPLEASPYLGLSSPGSMAGSWRSPAFARFRS